MVTVRSRADIPRASIAHTVETYRSGTAVARDLARLYDRLVGELAGALRDAQPGQYRQPARQQAAWERLDELVDERLDRYVSAGASIIDEMWAPTVIRGAGFSVDVINAALGADVIPPPRSSLARIKTAVENQIVRGQPMPEWWEQHRLNIRNRFISSARLAVRNGLTPDQTMASQVTLKQLAGTRRHVRVQARTAVTTAANDGAAIMYEDAAVRGIVQGVQHIAILDSRTCRTCVRFDHKIWRFEGGAWIGVGHDLPHGPPPTNTHHDCRCDNLPTLADWADMPADVRKLVPKSQRASVGGPVAGDTDYDRWVREMSDTDLREVFGARVASRIRSGDLHVSDAISDPDFDASIPSIR